MFFVGASAMPGTGVPVVCAGSGIVADMVDHFLKGRSKGKGGQAVSFALALLCACLASAALLYIPTMRWHSR